MQAHEALPSSRGHPTIPSSPLCSKAEKQGRRVLFSTPRYLLLCRPRSAHELMHMAWVNTIRLRMFASVCVCLCLFASVYVCVCVCLCMFASVCACLRLSAPVCACLRLFASVCACWRLYMAVCLYMAICLRMCVCKCMRLCACVYLRVRTKVRVMTTYTNGQLMIHWVNEWVERLQRGG